MKKKEEKEKMEKKNEFKYEVVTVKEITCKNCFCQKHTSSDKKTITCMAVFEDITNHIVNHTRHENCIFTTKAIEKQVG